MDSGSSSQPWKESSSSIPACPCHLCHPREPVGRELSIVHRCCTSCLPLHYDVNDVHKVNPMLFIFSVHTRISLVGNIVERQKRWGAKPEHRCKEILLFLIIPLRRSQSMRFPCSSRTRKSPFSKPAEMVAMFMALMSSVASSRTGSDIRITTRCGVLMSWLASPPNWTTRRLD